MRERLLNEINWGLAGVEVLSQVAKYSKDLAMGEINSYGGEIPYLRRVCEILERRVKLVMIENPDNMNVSKLGSNACVVFSNHPTLTTVWMYMFALHQVIECNNFAAVAKAEFLENPFLKWILGGVAVREGKMVVIDREHRKNAVSAIQNNTPGLLQEGTALMIFPDGTRYSDEKRDAGIHRLQSRFPGDFAGIEDWMTETVPPKVAGLEAILRQNRDSISYYGCTWVEPRNVKKGGECKLHIQKFSLEDMIGNSGNFEQEKNHLARFLMHHWQVSNELIREGRKQCSF